MGTNRKRKRRTNSLQPWEKAFLLNDESFLRPGTRDRIKLETMRRDPDGWMMFGDRTARELLDEFPEYKKRHTGI